MLSGIFFALSAGLMWGLIFIGPLIIPDYPAALQSSGRYLAFGLIALPLAWLDRGRLKKLSRGDWLEALRLSAVGNLLYYLFLASAIQRTGAPVSSMIIGTLPVIIAVSANLLYGREDGQLSWRRLAPSLLLIIIGLVLVNIAERQSAAESVPLPRYLSGIVLALLAVVCWTWYPLRNSRWLRQHPSHHPMTWATAQGIATLPLAFVAYVMVGGYLALTSPSFSLPLGPQPERFIGLMLAIGLLGSWLGTICWNAASQRLPTALMGPMLVFETLSALAYTFMLRQSWPPGITLAGIACLVCGVISAMRIKPQPIVSADVIR
ncbi:DMT family transporter [Lonsdalea quercina]|uniref:DMT family transporter n=1 Tax=Lonsdalea quercina TaxID=71657 RepID=UPI003975034B